MQGSMQGLMQDWPLRVHTILDHAARWHGEAEIVTRTVEGPIHRTTYTEIHSRARKVSKALAKLGVKEGEVIGTLAWNTHRHMEVWYGIMGLGAVCHTTNPRLFPEQIVYIVNHGEDAYLFADTTFVPLLEGIADKLPKLKGIILMTDAQHMPETHLANVLCYEELLGDVDDDFAWAAVDENAAAGICYTSGTTGNPKGVVYSHRSNVLHALAVNSRDALGFASVDSLMPVVPMFHANAWGTVFTAPMAGAKLVMPGADMSGQAIHELLESEEVTCTAAVPTVWLGLFQYMDRTGKDLTTLKRVVIGGAACPQSMLERFEKQHGVDVIHAWGMTEMSPLGTLYSPKRATMTLPEEEQFKLKIKQGRPPYTVDMRIVNDGGEELPWDGTTYGHLQVRGPAVAKGYFKGEGGQIVDSDNWFTTGDVTTIDHYGFMQITDRSKDVIKSGGEWISSIDLENLAVGHPDVAEAAVIGAAHPKWDERPLLIIVPREGAAPQKEDILSYLEGKIAKWWMPDDVVFVTEIPHTATGKIQKTALREQFKDYTLPTASNAAE